MTTLHSRLFAATLLLAPAALYAQTTPKPTKEDTTKKVPIEIKDAKSDSAKAGEDDSKTLDVMEVTGSRIRTLGTEATAIPVFSMTQVELEQRGVTRLADIRWAIPQLAPASGFNDNLVNSGTSRAQTVSTSFNLRGLGGNSTLVLIDGRRVPHTGQEAPGGAGGREDFSVDGIPISAIERIEVLPQGAGAVYGSEAIAGVINIILKKNFSGAEFGLTYDNTFESDVGQLTASVTGGYRKGKWRGFVSASYEKQNGMASRDRWFTATADNRVYGAPTAQAFYLQQVAAGTGSFATNGTPLSPNQPNLPGLTTNIVAIPAGSNGTTAANASVNPATLVSAPFDPNQYSISIDPARRRSINLNGDYEAARWLTFYASGRASDFRNDSVGTPITLNTSLPAGYPGNPFASAVQLRKVFWDLPLPRTISTQENLGLAAGIKGAFLETWRYDAGVNLARNIVSDDAITASGFNTTILGQLINNPDPALRPILAYDSTSVRSTSLFQSAFLVPDHEDTTDYRQVSVTADGSIWSGWAGDFKAAVGAEAGEEKVKFYRDPSIATPTFVLSRPFSRDTTAAFAETRIPLLSDRQRIPLVHRLEIGGAVRTEEYSDSGNVVTPTYHALFQPVTWVTMRASRAEGFKPVRLFDLIGPATNLNTTLTTTSNVRDNRRGGEAVIGTFPIITGGNASLKPEESVSKSAGIVIDVPGTWFKGLSVSADYYQIVYNERSGAAGTQVLFDFFPERVTRAPATAADTALGYPGIITGWNATNINLAGVRTSGWDYRIKYSRRFGFGDIQFHAAVSDSNDTYTKSTPAAVSSSANGHGPARGSASLFWMDGPWSAGVTFNYQQQYTGNRNPTTIPNPEIHEFNPQVSYNFGKNSRFNPDASAWWARWLTDTKFTVTVVNVWNEEPSLSEAANFRINQDPRLRRYIVSLSKKL